MPIRGAPDYSYLGIPPLADQPGPKPEVKPDPPTAVAHIRDRYWDIAIVPIRPGYVAASFHRVFGGDDNQYTQQDGMYICEAPIENFRSFLRDGARFQNAALECAGMTMQFNIKKGGREFFVGEQHGKVRATGHGGSLSNGAVEAMIKAMERI